MTTDAEYHLVLVIMRAGAIWGTRKQVSRVLILGYMGYVLIMMGGATYGIATDKCNHFSPSFTSFVC